MGGGDVTLPVLLILGGTLLIYAGWKGYSPTRLLLGSIEPKEATG